MTTDENKEASAPASREPGFIRDVITLSKPGITIFNVLAAAGGWALAPDTPGWGVFIAMLIGTCLSVAAANSLNMWMEREGDKDMERTKGRPLPAGRMTPATVLVIGITGAIGSAIWLAVFVNALAATIASVALILYAFVYTPMKRRHPQALGIGAIPGAAPPLVGWVAATNSIDAGGLILFAILFVWQLPHFLAIAIYRKSDYAAAGIKTVAVIRGDKTAKVQSLIYTALLLPVSLLLLPMDLAGWIYGLSASVLGVIFLVWSLRGFKPGAGVLWAKKFFFYSLVYLPALIAGLVLDRVLLG